MTPALPSELPPPKWGTGLEPVTWRLVVVPTKFGLAPSVGLEPTSSITVNLLRKQDRYEGTRQESRDRTPNDGSGKGFSHYLGRSPHLVWPTQRNL